LTLILPPGTGGMLAVAGMWPGGKKPASGLRFLTLIDLPGFYTSTVSRRISALLPVDIQLVNSSTLSHA
jgi:hypothetical protein